MPFNVHLADNEDPHIHAQPTKQARPSESLAEFRKGLSFGIGIVIVLLAAYALYAHVSSFPDAQALRDYWLSAR